MANEQVRLEEAAIAAHARPLADILDGDMLAPDERLRMAEALFVHDAEGSILIRPTVAPGARTHTQYRAVVRFPVGASAVAVGLAPALWAARGPERVRRRLRAVVSRPTPGRRSA
jgi:hypothetical protein